MVLSGDRLTDILTKRFRANAHALNFEHVAEFCDVKLPAVRGWTTTRKPLGGLCALKLWHFLAQVGIDSPELVKARKEYPLGEYLGRLLAFDVLSLKDACELGGVKKDAIFAAARTQSVLIHCKKTFESLKDEHDELLVIAVDEFRDRQRNYAPVPERAMPTAPPVASTSSLQWEEVQRRLGELETRVTLAAREPGVDQVPGLRLQLIQEIAEKLQAAHVAANVAFSQFSPEERDLLRTLMGSKGMFEFSNVLERLCTERAFHHRGV